MDGGTGSWEGDTKMSGRRGGGRGITDRGGGRRKIGIGKAPRGVN